METESTQKPYVKDMFNAIMKKIGELNHLKDVDAILDKILYEARRMSHADAGTIFLVEEDILRFAYVHNDTLFNADEATEEIYLDFALPMNNQSIVGYAASRNETVEIDDAYQIPPDRPYSFNDNYDRKSGYKTVSMLTIPLQAMHDRLVGVMQLINAKDENGQVGPFTQEALEYIPLFANDAAVAISRGIMTREMILRMVKMAELRDPAETGPHVQRVGAFSAEIYQQLAKNQGVELQEMKRTKDTIRLASMLHDVGKVGIPDKILKKPGKLDDEEYNHMKWHTVFGGRLFANQTSNLDTMSMEIALYHHEKWAGGGYPGNIDDIMSDELKMNNPKKVDEIPLPARITALADVYDALSSKRCYKEAWTDEKSLGIIKEESGKHFAPNVVDAFFQILPIIKAIQKKYKG